MLEGVRDFTNNSADCHPHIQGLFVPCYWRVDVYSQKGFPKG